MVPRDDAIRLFREAIEEEDGIIVELERVLGQKVKELRLSPQENHRMKFLFDKLIADSFVHKSAFEELIRLVEESDKDGF